jgi:murein DD-endopeptidase MepM/ murein hydrolase activator NlpD
MLRPISSAGRTVSPSPAHTSKGTDYRIRLGDTLGDIAKRNGVSVDVLAKANGISNPNKIFAGQTITIPTGGKTQTVERGDTLTKIAAENNTTVDALMKANPEIRNANQIYPGQVVRIAGTEARSAPKPAPRVQTPQAPVAKAPDAQAPVAPKGPVGPTTSGQINLKEFFDPSKGSKSPAAIVIGNAEGNRTPTGGITKGYAGHIDPGNGKGNRGSFSYQNGKGLTPEQADRAQLTKLSKLIPSYEAAAKKAGLDPNNATLATAYFDLYNQSPTAAGRFLNQIEYLKTAGISNQSVTELRFRSFINPSTGQRWTPGTASGFQEIANKKHGGKATEAQFQTVIRKDQQRRQDAMVNALKAQDVLGKTQGAAGAPGKVAETQGIVDRPTGKGILTKWPVSNPQLNVADKAHEGDGHYDTKRGKSGRHGGIDLVGKLGDPIFAASGGKVVNIQPNPSTTYGYQIVIDHGNGVYTQYAHLQKGSLAVKPGDTVTAGQTIAGMGRTGNTPPNGDTHLHFEVRLSSPKPRSQGGKTVDPLKYLGQIK